ncbi:Por secretion system C-terminal sorting domain-containing protein (modular protein) [Tenacibaculum sediminilitoris]|uniref:T9SS type A sorting domain-containing protein n=1 Tax=Tenacibaculum sediminilitoris TaxID=1820334 RepID=UPI003894CC9F
MRHYYFKFFLNAIVYSVLLFANDQLRAQTPSTMEFGSSTVVLATGTNPSADQSASSLLNSFDMSGTSNGNITLALATSGNQVGTDAIGGTTDAVLAWAGNGSSAVSSATLSTDSGGEVGITSMQFAYEQAVGGTIIDFTFTGKKDGAIVGTLSLVSSTHNSAISIDFTSPTTGSFSDIDELIITPDTQIFGGFSIDEMIVTSAVSNTAPVIGGTTAGQSVNDNSTISPFSSITTTDADGDNLSATITLDNNAKGVLSGTGLTGTGPYTIASTTPADLQTKLRALSFNPTDNRTATTETTTFTVVINDGTIDDTDNTTTVISSAVAPSISSVNVPANATYITGQNLDFTVNFDENVTVNTTGGIPQIAITIGATTRQATYISGSGTSALVFRHTVLSGDLDTDGIAVGALAANGSTLKDSGGKDATLTLNSVGSTSAVLVDAATPTVTSVSVPTNGNYLTNQNLDFTVNFDENITVNTTGGTPQIVITIGATTRQAVYQSGSGTTALVFRYTVQAGDSDTDGIAVGTLTTNGGTLKDAASNDAVLTLNNVGATTGVLVDGVAPTVTSVSVPTNGNYLTNQNLDFTVNFDENITVNTTGGTPQIVITIGATTRQAVYLSGSGTSALVFRYTVQAGDSDTDGIAVGTLTTNGGTLKDTASNDAVLTLNNVGATTGVLVDGVAPTVTSVSVPTDGNYLTSQNLDFTVNFDENITVNTTGGTPQIVITIGATTRQAVYLSGSGTSALVFRYTVQSGDSDTDGIAVGTLTTNGGTLKDVASNDAVLTLNNVGATTGVLVDGVAPTVTSVSVPTDGNYLTSQNLDFTVNFDENITVNTTGGTPQIVITIGATTRQAVYLSGSGTSALVFRYIVQSGDLDTDGITVGTLATNGGTLKDAASNDANLTLNSIGATTGVLVDGVAPTVTSVSVPTDGNYLTSQNLDFTVNFDENITVNTTGGTPQIVITIGATTRQAVYLSGSGTSALVFRYTVQAGDSDTDGIAVGTLAANGGTLKDAASNDAVLTLNSVGNTTNVLVGIETVTWSGSTDNDWNTASNWSPSVVPPTNSDIVIPSGLTNYPTASSAVTFNSLTINNGASFIPQSTVTGTVTYKRNLATTNWYLVSSPVVGETIEDIIANHTLASGTAGNLGLAPYSNITGPAWLYAQSGSTGTVTSGTGISVKLATSGDVSTTGTMNTTNVNKAISTGSRTNYNLIGNPFTAYVNSASFTTANTALLADETIWLWDGTQYITKNAIDPIEIAPGQGFFVEAAAAGNVTFSFANQSHNADTFMRQEPIPSLELSVDNKKIKRSTKVFYASGKTTGYDKGYDSKIFGESSSDLAVYTELLTNNQGDQLAIQTLPDTNLENMIIPVGMKAESSKEITFSINTKNLPSNINVYLEDRKNKTFTNLSEENYTVTLTSKSNGIGQFYLHTSAKKPTEVDASLDNISIYSSLNNEITIVGLQTKANVAIYSVLGKEVFNQNITSNGVSKISVPSIATGVYIVKLKADLGEVSKKVILK